LGHRHRLLESSADVHCGEDLLRLEEPLVSTICRFCEFDFSTADAAGLIVARCHEHDSPICPRCYCCQAVPPALPIGLPLEIPLEIGSDVLDERWRDAT